jgi:nitrite reductase (NADH) large subunit
MKYLIIGNGIAGTTAALQIRKFDANGEITIVTEEDLPLYSRIRLPEYLAGAIDEKKLLLFNDVWYDQNKIALITNNRVASIDPGTKQILLDGNARIPYDKLLVATGSRALVPALLGVEKKGVFTLRTIADARRIKEYAEKAISIVILGGGVLGLEIGNALRNIGKSVTFVEFFPRLLPRQMDVEGSRIFREKLESYGLRFVLDARAEKVLGNDAVEGLILQDGSSVKGQMLILSAGIKPEISLFNSTGISLGKGVPVNDRMETELPDVYAAGDAAEHRGMVYGIWPAAEKQGEVAGINMAGGNTVYTGTTPSHSITVAGIEVLSAGEIDIDCKLPSLVFKDKEKGIYKKIVIRDDCVAGCIFCGDTTGRKEIVSAIRERRPVTEMQESFERLNLTWMQPQE